MAERRTLVEGLDTIEPGDRRVEEQFVYGKKSQRGAPPAPVPGAAVEPPRAEGEGSARPAAGPVPPEAPSHLLGLGRVPVGARIRTERAAALKRASLERQLKGVEPNSIQDILEEALAAWLERHGYLT
jgi:hypothetical protein